MAHGYRLLQHWNQWLSQHFLGGRLLETEQQILSQLVANHYGKHALLIGVSHQYNLLKSSPILHHSLITPIVHKEKLLNCIEGDFHELPIFSGSVDLVMIPHTLEFVDNPRRLLNEACRIIKPEGLIAVCCFNPYSLWGLKKILMRNKNIPWSGNFMSSQTIQKWLRLAEFQMEKRVDILFTPPLDNPTFYQKLNFLECFASKIFPRLGGGYVLLARAKVIPLTPIKLRWKQQLSGIRISTTISGHIARQSK